MDSSEQLAQSWEINAAAWTRAVRNGRIESRRLVTDAAVLEAVLRLSPARVLDIGCGEGWLCRALTTHGAETVGVDKSAPLIEAAREEGGGHFVELSYADLIAGATGLSEPGFDVAVCNFSLLGDEIASLMRAVRACLRPGGAVVIQTMHPWSGESTVPYADGWRSEDFSAIGEEGFAESMPWYFRTLQSWFRQLRSAGFTVASADEPVHPETGKPLSLLLTAIPV